jgi:hypothetical protein
MNQGLRLAAVLLSAASSTPVFAAPLTADPTADGQNPAATAGRAVTDNRIAISQRFPSLDAYLAYLEKRSHMDGAWYRQIRPGVYELQTGNLRLPNGGQAKRVFTRQELEEKFGFSR